MKVALCLSGFPRTMEYSYPYLEKYIINELNPDVFFFGYEDEHSNKEKIQSLYKTTACVAREYTPEVEEEIWDRYETRDIHDVQLAKGSPISILSQYYNMFKSNELKRAAEKEGKFLYDIVIRARTDYYFFRKIEQSEIEAGLQERNVCIPSVWDFKCVHPLAVSSGFAYGNSATMDIYSNLFNQIREYNLIDRFKFHPESLKGYHVNQHLNRIPVRNHYWWEIEDFETNGNQSSYIEGLTRSPSRSKWK